jgi:uncharacterized protein
MVIKNIHQASQYAVQRLEQELPPGLFYHSLNHTRNDVVPATMLLADREGVAGDSLTLLLTAAWFHDLGFIEQRLGHEMISVRIARDVLPGFGYSAKEIDIIQGIILATVVPQTPVTNLEKILADADLDVLGRDDFMSRNGDLRRELAFFGSESSDEDWYSEQLKFVGPHVYFTASGRMLRDAGQAKNVEDIKRVLKKLERG